MPRPTTLNVIATLAANSGGIDILLNDADALLKEPSVIVVYMNREDTDVEAQIKIGSDEVMALSGSAIQAAAGVVPSTPDDQVVISMGKATERVQVLGTNVNAATRQLRVLVKIFSLADVLAVPALLANA